MLKGFTDKWKERNKPDRPRNSRIIVDKWGKKRYYDTLGKFYYPGTIDDYKKEN